MRDFFRVDPSVSGRDRYPQYGMGRPEYQASRPALPVNNPPTKAQEPEGVRVSISHAAQQAASRPSPVVHTSKPEGTISAMINRNAQSDVAKAVRHYVDISAFS